MGTQPPNYPPPGGYQPGGYQPGGGYPPPGGMPPGGPGGKTQVLSLDYNIAGLLCYIPICCISIIAPILFLVTEPKENKFLRFHAIQSLALTVVGIVIIGVLYVLSLVFIVGGSAAGGGAAAGAGIIGLLLGLVELLVGLVWLVLAIVGCVKAYQNQMWQMPIVGGFADKKS